jgi:hypothetical protein
MDSVFTYPVSNNYVLTFTLKNAGNIAINNGVRYYRGGNPSLGVSVNSSPADSACYYTTTIEAYNENWTKIKSLNGAKNTFSLGNFVMLRGNITVNVLIEYWRDPNLTGARPVLGALPYVLSSNQFSIRYYEDATAPVVSIASGGQNIDGTFYTNQSPIELAGSASDSGSGVNGGTWQYKFGTGATQNGNRFSTPGGEFSQPVLFQASDNLGNVGSKTVYVTVDKTPPVVNVTADPSSGWSAGPVIVTATASDSLSGINANAWQYSSDGGSSWSAEGATRQLTLTREGRHDVRFRVKDRSGNAAAGSIECVVDKTPPVMLVSGDWGDAWSANAQEMLGINIYDELSGIALMEYSRDNGSSWETFGAPQTSVDVSGEGMHTVIFRATDTVGNTDTIAGRVNIDTSPPTYVLATDGCPRRENGGWTIPLQVTELVDSYSGVDYDSFYYSLDGGALTKLPGNPSGSYFNFSIEADSLAGGDHAIQLNSADKIGNIGEKVFSFFVDTTPPLISGGSLLGDTADEAPWNNKACFSYAATDPDTGIKSRDVGINTVLANGYVVPFSDYHVQGETTYFNSNAPDGTYQAVIKATDNANNACERIFYYRLDRTAPEISPRTIKSGSRSVTIRGTDALSGLDAHNCWASEVAGVPGDSGYAVTIPNGFHEAEFALTDIAGNTVVETVSFYIDENPPTVSVTAPEFSNSEKLPVSIGITSAVLEISDVWVLVDGVKTVLGRSNWNSVEIPIPSYTEGIHTVQAGAMNEVGISGESVPRQFVIDKIPPEIKGCELRDAEDPERIIAAGDYISGGALRVKIVGEDLYRDAAGMHPGAVKSYSWAVTRRLSDTPVFSAGKISMENEFTVQGFSDGMNYLCVRAEDAAGNPGETLKITTLQDRSSPGAPVIKSSTHAEASRAEQAGFLSRGEFSFSPDFGVKSGIKSYQWKIEKLYVRDNIAESPRLVMEGEAAEIDQEGKSGLSIELEDNDENEFYQLLVRCVGGNGLAGPWASYRFRIDSTAPGALLIQALPLADSSSWHNQKEVLARWNKPSDMTGVAEYRHILLDEEDALASPPEERDTSLWSKTADTQVAANLRNIAGAKRSGKVRIAVSAVDYAGNSRLGQFSFGYDFLPPRFGLGALDISDAEDALGVGKRIRWGGIQDGESGPDRIVILVSSGDRTSAFAVNPELTEYLVSSLEENQTFTVVVRGYDRAGNQTELYDVCATGNAVLPQTLFIPYKETVNGYDISGKKRVEGGHISFEGLTLRVPEALELYAGVDSNGGIIKNPLGEIPLEDASVVEGIFQAGRSGEGIYELRSGGFTLEASALSFSRDRGLALENAAYVRPVRLSGTQQERRIPLGPVSLGNPPLAQFSSGSSALGVAADIENLFKNSDGETRGGFTITGVESLLLAEGREWFAGAGISFDRKPLDGMGISLGDAREKVALKNSSTEALSRNLVALLDIPAEKPLRLAMGKAVYRVARAGIRGNLLDIYEAVLPLPPGYEPSELILRNFTIDTGTGIVREGPDFSAGALAVTGPGGMAFDGARIRLDSQGNLLVTGSVTSETYGVFGMEDILLANEGIDWDLEAKTTGFSTEVHGFLINAQKARVTGSGLLIVEGKIDVWGNRQTVAGLGLRIDIKNAVWQEGSIGGSFYGDPNYGGQVQMSGGKVAYNGVFADAAIPLGNGIVDAAGAKHWVLPQARLYPNGVMAGSFSGEKKMTLANVPVRAENCFFDEQGLQIGKLWVEHIPGLSPEALAFAGMRLSYQGVSAQGVSDSPCLFAPSGWQISYASLGFDGQGIKGSGSLKLPEKLGGLVLVFPESRITAEGLFVSGNTDETREILRFQGVPLFAAGVGLKLYEGAHVLELASPRLSLAGINGPDIFFGKTIFDAGGKALLGEHENRKIDFVSLNGYRMGLENSQIDDQGFSFGGSVSLRILGKDMVVPGGRFRMLPDLSVTGTAPGTGLAYRFGDWSISCKDFSFDADRIRIGSNRVLFREVEFDLGEIPFSLEGLLLQNVARAQELDVSLFGAGARIAETRLSDGGIEASVTITLPAVLGGESFSFDKVGFKANGDFWIEKKVDAFSFAALGFSFAMEEVTLDKLGLWAAKASITLPESMENANFTVKELRIAPDGGVGIGSAEVSPFALWNMNFTLDGFSIVDGEAAFQGKLSLPGNLPGELPNHVIAIRDFRASLGGGISAMDIVLEGDYRVPFGNAWNLLFSNVRIIHDGSHPWISADRTELLFPEEYAANKAYIEKAKVNPLSGEFAFSEIAFESDLSMDFFGLGFTLNSLKIDSQYSVTFGGSAHFPGTGLPAFLAGKTAVFNRFEIKADGTLGAIDIKLEGLEGSIVPGFDGLVLKKGSLSLLKQGDKSLILDIGGNITLGASMPDGLAGAALKIETFTYDTEAREIRRLKATTVLPTANSLGNLFSKLSIGIDWNEAKQTGLLNLGGNLKFPSSFPAFLAGKEARISNFKIGFDGAIQSFTAKYATEKNKPYDAFGFLQLSDVAIEAALKAGVMKFDLEGTALLPEGKFPQGIGGLRTEIAMEFDTVTGLKTASARASLPDSKLFGSMDLSNGMIEISKPAGKALEISVGGMIVLPDFFPIGLRGIALGINALTINSAGEILDVDIEASGIGAKIFGLVELSNGSISFKKGEGHEFLVNVGGSVRLDSAGLPDSLRNTALDIRVLELSTRDGLRRFDAGAKGELGFSILGGIKITVQSLNFSETGISMAALAKLPANYPNGLANTQFALNKLKLQWNGALVDIQGGIKSWSMTLAGFTATIEELYFDKDTAGQFQVALKSCKVKIPDNFGSFGGQYVAIKNAKFSPRDGSFLGDIEIAKLETEIAGFRLIMDKPSLSFSENLINFSKVTLKMPDFLGRSEIALKKVTLSATSGMRVSGGAFKLPNFNVGIFAFNNVSVSFSMSGSQYSLEGSGSVVIPGAGNISATLGFATKSATYPIGLKRAEFSYVLNVGGIPLGASGLFVNGIQGGISYGPPSEVPAIARGLFNNTGPRMKVGLHVGDSMGGSVISMSPTTWVDINNGTWAFEGRAAVLKGTLNLSAGMIAALGNQGFVGQFDVDIKFARGGVTVYVFDKAGNAIMSGEGYVQFGIPKASIVNTWLVKIPSSNLWIAKVSAAFGRFTNGKTGIKGTIKLPVLGTVGAFVGSGGLALGSLSGYVIEKPSWSRNIRFFGADNVDSHDIRDSRGNVDVLYQLFVPPKGSSTSAPLSLLHEEYAGNESVPDSGLDRLVVVLEYLEGAPELTVISPLGIEYREGHRDCEAIVEENGIVLAIHSAEAGIWQLRVRGLEEEAYRLSALGSMAMPELELVEPALLPAPALAKTRDNTRVRGKAEKGMNSVRVFARESMELPGFDLGSYAVDDQGRFDLTVSLEDLADGEYFIYAELDGPGVDFSPAAYAPGKVVLDRSALPLPAPQLRVAETDSGILSLRWHSPRDGRVRGYKVKIYDHENETESILYAGNIAALDLPGYGAEQKLSFSVAALDHADMAGPWSEPVSVQPGEEKPLVNRPVAVSGRVEAKGFSGGFIEGVIRADIANFLESADSEGHIGIRYAGPPLDQFLNIHFGPPAPVSEQGVEIPWSMAIAESLPPGLYEYPCEFFNEANGALNSSFVLAVEVDWPAPEIRWVDPGEINGISETALVVHGSGFVPGTRVFWRGEELPILDSDSGSLRVNVPPRFGASEAQRGDTEQGELVVQGPGGDRAVFPVTVLLPSYRISLYARIAETLPGGRAEYPIALESLNGFEGSLSFRALEKPEGMEIFLPEFSLKPGAAAGAAGTIAIRTEQDILPGSHKIPIEGDGGKLFELVLVVSAEPPLPALASIIPRAASSGDSVHVHGNNFGKEGKLFVNSRETPVSSWTEGEIVFVVPDDALSGDVYILSAGAKSNSLSFTVKDRGFALRPFANVLSLNAGEEKKIPLALTGHANTVSLSLACDPGAPFAASLSRTALKSGEPLELIVNAGALAGNGSWNIVVHGESRGFEASAEIKVVIGSSLRIATPRLPDGIVDVGYYAALECENARGALSYSLAAGSFPPGISMTAQGIISGRPGARGRHQMDIAVHDSQGWKDRRSFTITVWEENWGQAGKDGGNTRSASTDLPANNNTAWTYQGEEDVAQLLGAEDRIIARDSKGIFALNARDGSLCWNVKGAYKALLCAGAKLYALAEGGRLEVRDPLGGALLWDRENIEAISSDGVTVLEETATGRFFRNAERGTLIQEQGRGEYPGLPLLWHYGAAYFLRESALVPLYGAGTAWDAGEKILAAAADIRGGAAITEGSLILFDRDMRETQRIAASHAEGATLSLTSNGVSVLDGGQLRSYDREKLGFQWARGAKDCALLANGVEKTVVAGPEGLTVLNRYDGGVIWMDGKPCADFVLYHGQIVAAAPGGSITAFNGAPNVSGPVTELRIDPPDPGASLWHTRQPRVEITSADRETYVERILMRHNNGAWVEAPPSFVPEDGEHHIAVYGVDSRGMAGAEARLQFRVDTGLPESSLEIIPEKPESGWHNRPVTIVIEARDEVSGIDWIRTSDSAYTAPKLLSAQGTHRFSWQALDRAGNQEPLREIEIRIDLEPPLVEASLSRDSGLAELGITASDALSGVAFIEYRINDGVPERYGEPLVFVEPGSYSIGYRAFDRAGNSGEWQHCDVFMPPDNAGADIFDTPLFNGAPRKVMSRARNGLPLVNHGQGEEGVFSPGDPEAIARIPPYALGADYICWDPADPELDEKASITFRTKRNTVIYLFLPRAVPAPRGWSLVEDGAAINRLYYPGGAAVYMRRYGTGSLAEIPGTPAGSAPPLVMAQEKGGLAADIAIRRENDGEALILDALVHPRLHSRRLPLQRRWLVNSGDGWEALEGSRYEAPVAEEPPEEEALAAPLRFRLELYTPDGEVELRAEKVYEAEEEL